MLGCFFSAIPKGVYEGESIGEKQAWGSILAVKLELGRLSTLSKVSLWNMELFNYVTFGLVFVIHISQ